MSTTLNPTEDFLTSYLWITPSQKKIFLKLQAMTRNFKAVFPSLKKLADMCGCSIKTIQRALAVFKKNGWVTAIKRGFCSNVYLMPKTLANLEVTKAKTWKNEEALPAKKISEENVHPNVHVLDTYSDSLDICTREGPKGPMSSTSQEDKSPIPSCVSDLKMLSDKDKRRLAKAFPEYAIIEARKDARDYLKWGNKIDKPIAFLWTQAKRAINKLRKCHG